MIFCHLQVMGPRVIARGEEADRLQASWIRGVKNGYAVAEHMTDIHMATIDHHLDAVGTTTDVAVRHVMDPPANALRRYWSFSRRARCLWKAGQRCQTDEAFEM